MIRDPELVKRAERFVKANREADVNPTVAASMRSFRALQEAGNDLAAEAHARTMLRTAEGLGMDVDPKPVKKSAGTSKKAAAKKSTRRRR
jgi:hypothetical protein